LSEKETDIGAKRQVGADGQMLQRAGSQAARKRGEPDGAVRNAQRKPNESGLERAHHV